jgi:hypothetical protein
MENYVESLLPFAVESKPIHSGDNNGRSVPTVKLHGRPVPPVKLRLHRDGTASVRLLGIWVHNQEVDPRLALLASIRRTNGSGTSIKGAF